MAGNVIVSQGSGTTIATDDLTGGGVQAQRIKIGLGVSGGTTGDWTGTISGQVAINQTIGTVSTANSYSGNLGNGGIISGTFEDVTNYAGIIVGVNADQNSASGGLRLFFSEDQLQVDQSQTYSISGTVGTTIQVPRLARYFKITYTNGVTPNASGKLRIQTIFGPVSLTPNVQLDTELPPANPESDKLLNPNVPGVGAYVNTWNALSGFWGRWQQGVNVQSGQISVSSGGLAVQSGLVGVLSGQISLTSGTVTLVPNSSGGYSGFYQLWQNFNSGANIKATPGQIAGWYMYNEGASGAYVKFYDTSLAANMKSGLPLYVFVLPASGGTAASPGSVGLQFNSGIGILVNANVDVSGTTAVISGLVTTNIFWK